ncbi:hypothetical protein P167DRAFT_202884 [Morchella conica CCBAS932]|uniref:C2H2-type domain-containing protein n=1 Tax=Morchella conica CCBAS932 TaxID=1392247 RepID=A0A3N4L653_9PEZI|nr:hypothetical protein P167DRAFT_202884 [Morchella conica CCBAS932]
MSLAFSTAPVNHHNGSHAHSQHYGYNHSMDRGPSDYQQSGLPSSASYPSYSNQQQAEPQSADQPASNYQTPSQEVRSTSSTYSSSATPSSEYGGTVSSSSRTPTFPPDYNLGGHRYSEAPRYHPSSSTAGGNPSVPAPSPHYAPPTNQQYAHYPPQNSHPMSETYSNGGHGNWRPEWGPPTGQHYMNGAQYNPHGSPTASVSSLSPGGTPVNRNVKQAGRKRISDQTAQHPLSQVYSFVPIPGAQQHKRPRRRYEEIERMYKCGYNGCEKAYGTLNHLNAHVTMQSHGVKRTPEEFKEIRKEWKARKKEEEAQRKAQEEAERQRSTEGGSATEVAQVTPGAAAPASSAQYTAGGMAPRQLPPIAYQQPPVPSVHYPAAPTATMDPMQQYQQPTIYNTYQQASYPQGPQQIFPGQARQAPIPPTNEEPDADADADPDVASAQSSYNQ